MKIKSQIERLPKSTIKLTITIPWADIKKAYGKTLEKVAKTIKLPGFRQGKAPLKTVEEKISKPALYQEMLQDLLAEAYSQAIQEQQIKPITNPQIKPLKTEENKDWQFEAITCEKPEIKLGDYQEAIKQELKTAKIWLPGQEEKKEKPDPQQEAQEKLAKVFETLAKTVKVELAPILVENEASRSLAQLLEEIKKLGLTLESYLVSIKKTAEQLRQEHQIAAASSLRLEFILGEVADDLKITVSDQEIDELIEKSTKNKQEKQRLASQKYYLASVLRRQKTIDKLLNL